jgi:hypothetical protein
VINIDITPAKRRFGRKPRKQWQFAITAGNGEPLDPRDTYANTGDILSALREIRSGEVRVHIHRHTGVETLEL